jgi:hypothetical protein
MECDGVDFECTLCREPFWECCSVSEGQAYDKSCLDRWFGNYNQNVSPITLELINPELINSKNIAALINGRVTNILDLRIDWDAMLSKSIERNDLNGAQTALLNGGTLNAVHSAGSDRDDLIGMISNGKFEMCKLVLSYSRNVKILVHIHLTYASVLLKFNFVKFFMELGIVPQSHDLISLFLGHNKVSETEEIIKMVLEGAGDEKLKTFLRLMRACRTNDSNTISKLLHFYEHDFKNTFILVSIAISNKNFDLLDIVKFKTDEEIDNFFRLSPTYNGGNIIVKKFISNGFKFNLSDRRALHFCMYPRSAEVFSLMLDNARVVDLNELMLFVSFYDLNFVKIVISRGAQVSYKDYAIFKIFRSKTESYEEHEFLYEYVDKDVADRLRADSTQYKFGIYTSSDVDGNYGVREY